MYHYNRDRTRRSTGNAGNQNSNPPSGPRRTSFQARFKVNEAQNYYSRAVRLLRNRGAGAKERHLIAMVRTQLESARRFLRSRNYTKAYDSAKRSTGYSRRFISQNRG